MKEASVNASSTFRHQWDTVGSYAFVCKLVEIPSSYMGSIYYRIVFKISSFSVSREELSVLCRECSVGSLGDQGNLLRSKNSLYFQFHLVEYVLLQHFTLILCRLANSVSSIFYPLVVALHSDSKINVLESLRSKTSVWSLQEVPP